MLLPTLVSKKHPKFNREKEKQPRKHQELCIFIIKLHIIYVNKMPKKISLIKYKLITPKILRFEESQLILEFILSTKVEFFEDLSSKNCLKSFMRKSF